MTLKGTDKTIFTDQIIVTNDKGRFEFTPLSSGTYIVVVECEGYETQTIKDVIINTGATTRLNVQMVAVAA